MRAKVLTFSFFAWGAVALMASATLAEDVPLQLKLADGKFDPAEVAVQADTPFKLDVTNATPSAIEFESFELHRERVVQPGETITVFLPGLAPGKYPFFDDFHQDVPAGAIVVQ